MLTRIALVIVLSALHLTALATEVSGRVQSLSKQAKVIQLYNANTKQSTVIKFTSDTRLIDASGIEDIKVNTKLKAEVDEHLVARTIQRMLVNMPAEQVITTEPLARLLQAEAPLFIGDARPGQKYQLGHLPGAVSTPANQLADNLNWLPADKQTPIIFYCGGVTCPLSPKALRIAKQHGYSDVRVYIEGIPGWESSYRPLYVSADWVEANLGQHQVIIDVRETASSFIPGAVHLPLSRLLEMDDAWNRERFPTEQRSFMGLKDKQAQISIVADAEAEALQAYDLLSFWNYTASRILEGGMSGWSAGQLPLTNTKASSLVYVRKPVPGAIAELAFVNAVKAGEAKIIDVRSRDEYATGRLAESVNIPLTELEQGLNSVPKQGLVILHCKEGGRAALAYTMLVNQGYSNVKFLDADFAELAKANGLPLI